MSESARLTGIIIAIAIFIIAIAIFAVPVFDAKAQGHGFHGDAAAICPYVFNDLYGGIYGAYGPEIYTPDQTYLQIYLNG